MSEREIGRVENLNRKTVARKLKFLGPIALEKLRMENAFSSKCSEVEFDDMETFEHTKMKPLSITLGVEYRTRKILCFDVSQMPAKGPLAKRSVKKYGYRADQRAIGRIRFLRELKELVLPNAIIRSDSNPHYIEDVKRIFPHASHERVLGKRGAVTGQGELKKTKFDPLFSLNHTCAMFRAHVGRLIRKTWNTTKKRENLAHHLAIYALVHNQRLNAAVR